jgi:hypothetical protein
MSISSLRLAPPPVRSQRSGIFSKEVTDIANLDGILYELYESLNASSIDKTNVTKLYDEANAMIKDITDKKQWLSDDSMTTYRYLVKKMTDLGLLG